MTEKAPDRLRGGGQFVSGAGQISGQIFHGLAGSVLTDHGAEAFGHLQPHFCHSLGEDLVDLLLDGTAPLVGDLRRDGVFFFVEIIDDIGPLHIFGKEAHHIPAEGRRNHDGGVVIARLDAVDGGFFIGKHPAHLGILPQ